MNKDELDLYLNANIKDVGRPFLKGKLANNHRYKQNEKYVHFFSNIKNFEIIHQNRNFEYLATFEIPMITLMISRGRGLYNYLKNGKFKQKYVHEYVINAKYIKPEYFIEYKKVKKYEIRDDFYKLLKNGKEIKSVHEFISNK